MDNSIAIENNAVKDVQRQINEVMESGMKDIRYKMLSMILIENGIGVDKNINDYDSLKKFAKKKLSKEKYKKIENEEAEAQKEVVAFIKELEDGGPNTITKFVREMKTNFLRPAAQNAIMLILSRALFDAALFLPSPVNFVIGGVSLGATILTGPAKALKEKKIKQAEQYDAILEDIETKRDENGLTTEKRYSQHEIDIIETFFREKEEKNNFLKINYDNDYRDVIFDSYIDMKAKISMLSNGDKLKLIKELNKLHETEDKLAVQIAKQKILQEASTATKVVGNVALGLGVGILMSNIDKEIVPLLKLPIPKQVVRNIFRRRTYYASNEFMKSFANAIGFQNAVEFSVIKNAITGSIKAFAQSRESKKRAEMDKDAALTPQQKMVFEIVKHDALYKHPESVDEINELATLGDLKSYLENLPANEQKDSINLLEGLIKDVNRKDKKELFYELGTMLGNSVLLAGNSILLYEIILALHGSLPLLFGTRGQENPEPQQQEEYATQAVPERNPATSSVPQEEPALGRVPQKEPSVGTEPVTGNIPSESPVMYPENQVARHVQRAKSSGRDSVLDENGELLKMPYAKSSRVSDVVPAEHQYVEVSGTGKMDHLLTSPYGSEFKDVITDDAIRKSTELAKSEVDKTLSEMAKNIPEIENGIESGKIAAEVDKVVTETSAKERFEEVLEKNGPELRRAMSGGNNVDIENAIIATAGAALAIKGIAAVVTVLFPESIGITGPVILAPVP